MIRRAGDATFRRISVLIFLTVDDLRLNYLPRTRLMPIYRPLTRIDLGDSTTARYVTADSTSMILF